MNGVAAYHRHFLVCTNRRTPDAGMPSCGANCGTDIVEALRRARGENGLTASVFIAETSCLGPCPKAGATVVVYPEAVWYVGVTLHDVAEIVASHMIGGRVVERLRSASWRLEDSTRS